MKTFSSNVNSVLLYGCEIWRVTKKCINSLQPFIKKCLRRILRIFCPTIVTNENLQKLPKEEPVATAIKRRKWKMIGHTLRKDQSEIERQALDWNPQGKQRRCRPRTIWQRTIEEEARKARKTWREVKSLAVNRVCWRCFVEALCSKTE
jgi:hypothetical protein